MPKKINDIVAWEDVIYLKTIQDRARKTVSIDLRKSGLYGNNEKAVATKVLEYTIENNYEFNNKKSIMKPYYLTMKKLNNEAEKKQYIIDNDLLYHEFSDSIAELHQQFYNIKQYLYENTEIKLNENGEVDKIVGIYVPTQFKEVREKFKEPLKINIDEFGEAIREINNEICNCRYIISDDGKRYIVLANENELEDNKELQIMKNKNVSEYLKLVSERNQCFSKYTGISDIFFINDSFCIEDTYSECLSYDIKKDLIEYLQQTEVIDKIHNLKREEDEEL